MLKSANMWDRRHNLSHKMIKLAIREKNFFLSGRSMQTRHEFIGPEGEKVHFGMKMQVQV
jgi:hypothetical protein